MTYKETIDFLYNQMPFYQKHGIKAYKADLNNIFSLCKYLDNPQDKFPSIHIAGTNGKGSSAHLTSAILQSAGYKVGLYTSPHLKDFRERIKISGIEISKEKVITFCKKHKIYIKQLKASFFEVTVAMAFDYFANQQVDIAIIEVGLGGRLDATNIIEPIACLITNIGYDHQAILGNTLEKIAKEKAGVIKKNAPVIISEYQKEIYSIFQKKAEEKNTDLYLASDFYTVSQKENSINIFRKNKPFLGNVNPNLKGAYQNKNIIGVLKLVEVLNTKNWDINSFDILCGIKKTKIITNFKGRWQILQDKPLMICDVGHNLDAVRLIIKELSNLNYGKIYFILGFAQDKDFEEMIKLFPKEEYYYFCDFQNERLLSGQEILKKAQNFLLNTFYLKNIEETINFVKQNATKKDVIFIGGSNFVVAEIPNL